MSIPPKKRVFFFMTVTPVLMISICIGTDKGASAGLPFQLGFYDQNLDLMLALEHFPPGIRHGSRSPGDKRYDRLSSRPAKAIAWLNYRPYPRRQLVGRRSNFISNDAAIGVGDQSRKDRFSTIDRSSPEYPVADVLGRKASQSPIAQLCAVRKECHRLIGANLAHHTDTMRNRTSAGHYTLLFLARWRFLELPSASISSLSMILPKAVSHSSAHLLDLLRFVLL